MQMLLGGSLGIPPTNTSTQGGATNNQQSQRRLTVNVANKKTFLLKSNRFALVHKDCIPSVIFLVLFFTIFIQSISILSTVLIQSLMFKSKLMA